jgi:hypothetical protein
MILATEGTEITKITEKKTDTDMDPVIPAKLVLDLIEEQESRFILHSHKATKSRRVGG